MYPFGLVFFCQKKDFSWMMSCMSQFSVIYRLLTTFSAKVPFLRKYEAVKNSMTMSNIFLVTTTPFKNINCKQQLFSFFVHNKINLLNHLVTAFKDIFKLCNYQFSFEWKTKTKSISFWSFQGSLIKRISFKSHKLLKIPYF